MSLNSVVCLPNGRVCHLASPAMRPVAKFMRWEIFKSGQYRRRGFELRPGDVVVDIGANIGMFALWAEPQIPGGQLVCIEPNPSALECLRKNVDHNALRNVTIVAAAVGNEAGTMELLCHPTWEALAHNATIDVPWFNGSWVGKVTRRLVERVLQNASQSEAAKLIVAKQLPLSHIMDEHGVTTIDFLKIDSEGGEYEILRGIGAAQWARIERVVIEYHEFGRGRDHRELVGILRDNGFDVEVACSFLDHLIAFAGARVGKIWAKKPTRATDVIPSWSGIPMRPKSTLD